eukprot:CAMPEP_0206136266 /NCGR_PEP_ID=MMETSP1473-20131121/1506_1 /ASSEMBLY_ACC=CAM_ASM_001109 /TAXON_ID=1461547 /ORGANISM="Stichococcus sp, Strain RCC1054" /LENGTH=37 /DNA_ID= /DNA_START= /DNA_END= /DNA_ORIENTATION=
MSLVITGTGALNTRSPERTKHYAKASDQALNTRSPER